jgi:hypothetical protein
MTRKDFILIADAIKRIDEDYDYGSDEETVIDRIVGSIADALATTNSDFRRETFIAATRANKTATFYPFVANDIENI